MACKKLLLVLRSVSVDKTLMMTHFIIQKLIVKLRSGSSDGSCIKFIIRKIPMSYSKHSMIRPLESFKSEIIDMEFDCLEDVIDYYVKLVRKTSPCLLNFIDNVKHVYTLNCKESDRKVVMKIEEMLNKFFTYGTLK